MIRRQPHWATAGMLAAAAVVVSGCVQDPLPSAKPVATVDAEITLPPAPERPLTVGVYNCIDTTGQRRPTQQPQELSTAVPADCTPYLIQAVRSLRPGYVFLVERQHVDELLRERQLATLALNSNSDPAVARKLNMLRVAELLLVGQVVAYDRSTREVTGGLSFAGIGANTEIVTDLVTFSLRAVAVQTGEIMGESSVTKSITSVKAGGQITKIFSTAVLQGEAGASGNEPVGLALKEAVRGALAELIKVGIRDGWWS